MKTLLLKLFRDIKTSIGGFISIIVVIGIGSAFFSGLSNSVTSVKHLISNYYDSQNFTDYIAYFRGVTADEILDYENNENIDDIELRHTFDTTTEVNNRETDLRVHTLTENINKPYLYEGNLPNKGEIILDKIYGKLNNLKIGDVISFDYNGMNFELKISGFMDSPEYVYKVRDAFSGNVNFEGFGVGYITEDTLKSKFEENNAHYFYTDALIKSSNDNLKDLYLFKEIPSFVRMIDREEHISYTSFDGAVNQIDKVVVIFPIIFFLVAGIITFISMSKTVENQRTQIGIMGALGFSRSRIYFNYIMYSFIGSFVGSIIGGIIGIYTIPNIILSTFSAQYTFPTFKLKIYPEFIFYGLLISIAFSLAATLISCYKTLREVPANTLRPKPPKNSKHMFIERFGIWKKMSFISKIIIRNIYYNKMRLILSSVGMIGSIAFLITGFSLRASVDELLNYETKIRDYAFEIRTTNILDEQQVKSYDSNIDIVDESFTTMGTVYFDKEDIEVPIVIVNSDNTSVKLDNTNDEVIPINSNSVIVPDKFVKDYGINVGDNITIDLQLGNEIHKIDIVISDIANMYSRQMIYVSNDIIKDKNIEIPFDSAFVKLKDDSLLNEVVDNLNKNENIDTVTLVGDIRDYAKNVVSMINSVVMIILIGSAILAISVIYNITSINIFERVREISTLLVLGYYDSEINKLIFIENIVLTIFGGLLGIPFGIALFRYMQVLIAERGAYLPQSTSYISIVVSFIMILVFSIFTNMLLKRKVLKINMVEALKGVE